MGKASRDKGAAWEREVARLLRAAGVEARRGLGQARSASEVADVQVEGWWIEAKCGEPAKYPARALRQATEAAGDHCARVGESLAPVAICKPDRKPATAVFVQGISGFAVVVTVSLEDWIRIVVAEQAARETQGGE